MDSEEISGELKKALLQRLEEYGKDYQRFLCDFRKQSCDAPRVVS